MEGSSAQSAFEGLSRRERLRAELRDQIKELARKQLREQGPSGISLRAIARELGMSAPALHYHFPTLCDLVDALREDMLAEFGDAIEASQREAAGAPVQDRVFDAVTAYRAWACANPQEFNLIWGRPVRGCPKPSHGPTEVFARRGTALMLELGREALSGASSKELLQRCFEGWTQIHGFVSLEVNDQFDWLGSKLDEFFHASVRDAFAQLQLPPPRSL